jgi:O-succinylbenzoic acid--CoA ligase
VRGSLDRLELRGDEDVWLASLSLAHVGGLALVTRALYLGSTLLVPASARPEDVVGLFDEGSEDGPVPTHISLVPTQLHRILDLFGERRAPQSLRCVLIGGAHAPSSLVDRAIALGWPIALTYGATEMSSQIATASPALVRVKPGTVGEPLRDVEVRIDESGEILARGPTQALGYVGTDRTLADEDGWYHTGDLGRLDEDRHLWVTGRRIDRIVSGGVTIDAVEVEEALRAHPAVLDACVVGVADEKWGERVGAWIEPVVGEFDVEEVETELRGRLSAAKLPRLWLVEGGLPRNANGKVDREAVRARLG